MNGIPIVLRVTVLSQRGEITGAACRTADRARNPPCTAAACGAVFESLQGDEQCTRGGAVISRIAVCIGDAHNGFDHPIA